MNIDFTEKTEKIISKNLYHLNKNVYLSGLLIKQKYLTLKSIISCKTLNGQSSHLVIIQQITMFVVTTETDNGEN